MLNEQVLGRKVLIALGSNEESIWGDAKETVRHAISQLATIANGTILASNFYATAAFPAGIGPDYVNAAVAFDTTLGAAELLVQLHRIEAEAGRTRTARWGQRTLDLDLIAVADQVLPDLNTFLYWRDLPLDAQIGLTPEDLILPHPRMQDRGFVLIPLGDVAPEWTHPVSGLSVAQMRAGLTDHECAQVRLISES